jgi:hypothetical protein
MKNYHNKLTWKEAINDNIVEHHDGVLSMLATWDGYQVEMNSSENTDGCWKDFLGVLHTLSDHYPDILIELHLFREKDREVIPAYLKEHQEKMVRGRDVALPLLKDMANLYDGYARTNSVAIVVTHQPKKTGIFKKKTTHPLSSEHMMSFMEEIKSSLPNLLIRSLDIYRRFVDQSAYRQQLYNEEFKKTDYRFPLNEQWIVDRPHLTDDGYLRIDGVLTKVGLLYMQPDANLPAFFRIIADLNIDFHCSHIIAPIDTDARIQQMDKRTELQVNDTNPRTKNVKKLGKILRSADAFTSYVHENGERIFNNCFIVHLHGTPNTPYDEQKKLIKSVMVLLKKSVGEKVSHDVGEFRFQDNIQLAFWRVAMPGLGYSSPFFREDHSSQIANLAPIITFNKGRVGGEVLRLSTNGQPVGFSRMEEVVTHSFTVAMTRGGKGTEKCAEIIETYSRGVDWLGIEYGGTYQWLVEGLGGSYIKADVNTSINPFPAYSQYKNANDETKKSIKSSTLEGVAFCLLDGRWNYDNAEDAVVQKAFDCLYSDGHENQEAPLVENFLEAIKSIEADISTESQKAAFKRIVNCLTDFLQTDAGTALNRATNIDFDSGLIFVDFKDVAMVSKKQAVFLLNYTVLKFLHKGFLTQGKVIILMDELHKFMDLDAEATGNACKLVTRTGGKDDVWADLVTQGLTELQALDSEVLGSMPIQNLLYRQDQYDEIAKRLQIPDHVKKIWTKLENPINKNYRPHIKRVGDDWWNLYNIFPKDLLDIASTSPSEMPIKKEIADRMPADVWKRLKEFRRLRKSHNG